GQGRVLAVMTSAGQAWSDWAGGISGSVLYPAIIWEMQNYLSSSSGESSRPVGTPIRLTVDPKRFEGKALKASRYYYKAEPGKPIQVTPLEIGQFRDAPEQPRIILGEDNKPLPPDKQPVPAADNGAVTFTFRNTGEPGLYVTYLRFADQNEDGPPLATYGQIFNVDTKKEGKLQRASQEDLTSGFLREAPLDNPIEAPVDPIEPTTANEIPISARNDVSEWPWFFLLFLGILVGEQALAVHLSFHLKGTEAELPSQVVQPHGKAA
ncbi:MAG TPA: hypothetical protein VEL76_34670, partial [Gemmataceae bacterium]|nr:hypothetical protein [Gemmataceae bacterium]